MPFWYFLKIPNLPAEVAHQSNSVEIQRYLLTEGARVEPGMAIASVENCWAEMEIKANGRGFLQRTFFRPGQAVRVGDPIAIIGADGEDLPHERPDSVIEVSKVKRTKPS